MLSSDAVPPVTSVTRILYLARHGETDWNAEGRWQGHTDIPLNDAGRRQARELAEVLRPRGVRLALSSDLSRARETAQIVAQTLGVPLGHADPDLRERRFGVFEGLTRQQCEQQHAEAWQAWLKERRPPVGGEGKDAFAERVVAGAVRAIERLGAAEASEGAAALVVTHGGALRAFVEAVTGAMPPFVENGQVWRVSYASRTGFVDARPV